MKTTNHSQKPWRIWQNRVAPNQIELEIYDAQNYKLANIARWKDDGEEESKANAHLIASAPDLLEALRFLLADYIAIQGDKLTGSSVPIDMAQAAIAKAEGVK